MAWKFESSLVYQNIRDDNTTSYHLFLVFIKIIAPESPTALGLFHLPD